MRETMDRASDSPLVPVEGIGMLCQVIDEKVFMGGM